MKLILLPSVILLICIFSNCEKDVSILGKVNPIDLINNQPIDTVIPIIELGKVSFKANGENYLELGRAGAWINQSEEMVYLATYKTPSTLVESFRIDNFRLKTGKYKITERTPDNFWSGKTVASHGYVVDIDQILGSHYVDTTFTSNFVEVLRYDANKKTIEGRFRLKMLWPAGWNNYGFIPDTLMITDGKFHLKLD